MTSVIKLIAISISLILSIPTFPHSEKYRGEMIEQKLSKTQFAPKENACRLFLVRHAKTAWNEQGKKQGLNDVPLNESGKKQAEELAQKFADVEIAAIYTSVLSRAKDTADALAAYHPNAEIIYDANLRFYDPKKRYKADPKDLPAINAEISREIITSSTAYLNKVAEKYSGKNVIILTHGTVIKHLFASLTNCEIDDSILIANGAMVRVLGDKDGLHLEN